MALSRAMSSAVSSNLNGFFARAADFFGAARRGVDRGGRRVVVGMAKSVRV